VQEWDRVEYLVNQNSFSNKNKKPKCNIQNFGVFPLAITKMTNLPQIQPTLERGLETKVSV